MISTKHPLDDPFILLSSSFLRFLLAVFFDLLRLRAEPRSAINPPTSARPDDVWTVGNRVIRVMTGASAWSEVLKPNMLSNCRSLVLWVLLRPNFGRLLERNGLLFAWRVQTLPSSRADHSRCARRWRFGGLRADRNRVICRYRSFQAPCFFGIVQVCDYIYIYTYTICIVPYPLCASSTEPTSRTFVASVAPTRRWLLRCST